MRENRDIFLEGIKAEIENLIRNCCGTVDVMKLQLSMESGSAAAEYIQKLNEIKRNLIQLDYLKLDFLDLYHSRDPDFELSLELMNVSDQLELVCTSTRQQVREKAWTSEVLLESDKVLYANINPGYFYSICSNVISNLYYYSDGMKNIHIHVTENRCIEIYMEDVTLPEMVSALVEEYGSTAMLHRPSVGTCGLIFAVQFARAMDWKLSLVKTDSCTKVVLTAPAIHVSVSSRENLASDSTRRIQQQGVVTLRIRRAFSEIFGE